MKNTAKKLFTQVVHCNHDLMDCCMIVLVIPSDGSAYQVKLKNVRI